ncbi:hypothetical protein KEM60_02795 [Austwickia sp. TVS 96-490-7B]|nr:hypothetical protein [Austwickia sp. TVS 96-490-7B]
MAALVEVRAKTAATTVMPDQLVITETADLASGEMTSPGRVGAGIADTPALSAVIAATGMTTRDVVTAGKTGVTLPETAAELLADMGAAMEMLRLSADRRSAETHRKIVVLTATKTVDRTVRGVSVTLPSRVGTVVAIRTVETADTVATIPRGGPVVTAAKTAATEARGSVGTSGIVSRAGSAPITATAAMIERAVPVGMTGTATLGVMSVKMIVTAPIVVTTGNVESSSQTAPGATVTRLEQTVTATRVVLSRSGIRVARVGRTLDQLAANTAVTGRPLIRTSGPVVVRSTGSITTRSVCGVRMLRCGRCQSRPR